MITIKYGSIPRYLYGGTFFQSLSNDNVEEEMTIPADCYIEEDAVVDFESFVRMLKITAFWGLNCTPTTLILYCKNNDPSIWSDYIRRECTDLGFAQDLLSVFGVESNQKNASPLVRAISTNSIELVDFLAAERVTSTDPTRKAAECGRLDYLKLLRTYHFPWDETVCYKAAEAGHLDCLQYLHKNGCPWDADLHTVAASNGHIDCIKYALSEGLPWPEGMGVHITTKDNVEMLKFAIEQGGRVDEFALTSAAMKGHTECLRFLLTFELPLNERMVILACQFGHVSCLELLHQHGAKLTASAMHNAAVCEQVESVKFLHEHGCVWNLVVTQVAANRGNIEFLRYAIEHGCPYDKTRIITHALLAVSDNAEQCLEYLVKERKIPFQTDGSEFLAAVTYGNYKALLFLVENGCRYKVCSRELCKTWFETLSDHYDLSRDKEDENLFKCIEFAVSQDWDIVTYGAGLIYYVQCSGSRFSLCRGFLKSRGHC